MKTKTLPNPVIHGINTDALRGTIEAVKLNPQVAQTRLSVKTDWLGGTQSRDQLRLYSLANENEGGCTAAELSARICRRGPRWFLVRNVHATPNTTLLKPRWAMSADASRLLVKGDERFRVRAQSAARLRPSAHLARRAPKTRVTIAALLLRRLHRWAQAVSQ